MRIYNFKFIKKQGIMYIYLVLICKNIKMIDAGIAQLVEQLIRNQKIAGSSPVSSTIDESVRTIRTFR